MARASDQDPERSAGDAGAGSPPDPSPSPGLLRRSVSVVIPAYNEQERLPATMERVASFLAARRFDAEVVVVDDGSADRTADVVREFAARSSLVRVVRNPVNTGKGYAVRTGVFNSTREAILVTDADLSTPVEDLDRLWSWYDRGIPLVIGSRALEASELIVKQPLLRRGMGRVFNWLVSLSCLRGIRDTQCGFKLFRRDAARALFGALKCTGFAFDVEVLLRARRAGLAIAEVPVRWSDSRGSRIRPLRDSWRMALEVFRMKGTL